MSKRARRLWLLISVFAAGALAPLLVRPSLAERERLDANYNQIAGMTRTERLRLGRNFTEFQAMNPTEQARFRDLHGKLDADRQDNGLHVEVMDVYYDWLSTLRGDQRETLRKETDPQVRRELAELIVDEQQAPPPEFGDGQLTILNSQQLDAVFAIVEENVPFSAEQKQQLEALAPAEPSTSENPGQTSQQESVRQLQRHMLFLQFLIERFRSPDNHAFSFVPHIFHRMHEFGVLQQMLDATGDDGLKQQIMESQQGPGLAFGGMVWWSVREEVKEYRRNNAPTDARLNELFNSLPAARQDQLLSLGAQDFQRQLTDEYQKVQLQELNPSDDIWQLFKPWRWPPGDWGGGDRPSFGGGGPGNNPPGEGRGGGRGPGPFGNGPDRDQGGNNRGDNDDRRDGDRGDEDDDSNDRDRRDDNERRDDE